MWKEYKCFISNQSNRRQLELCIYKKIDKSLRMHKKSQTDRMLTKCYSLTYQGRGLLDNVCFCCLILKINRLHTAKSARDYAIN